MPKCYPYSRGCVTLRMQPSGWLLFGFDSSLTGRRGIAGLPAQRQESLQCKPGCFPDFKGSRLLHVSFGSAPLPLKLVPLENPPVQKPGAHNYDDLLHDLTATFILFSLVILGINKLHLILDKN